MLNLIISALSQGMIYVPLALGVYVSFKVLNTADLTIDGSFVFGMAVCAVIVISGYPIIAIFGGVLAGALAGFITGLLRTKFNIHPILSGILTMTGLYTINFSVMGERSNIYLQHEEANESGVLVTESSETIYMAFNKLLQGYIENQTLIALFLSTIIVIITIIIVCIFFKTRIGLAIRATGDNEEMVSSSSINSKLTQVFGLMLSNGLVALSAALLCQQQRYADVNSGIGMLVVGLASVIIGQTIFSDKNIALSIVSAAVGSLIYRVILQIAFKIDMPAHYVKLLSTLIVIAALTYPLIKTKIASRKKKKV